MKIKRNRKGNMGGLIFLAVILFNIGMYIFIRVANADAMFVNGIGGYSLDDTEINATTTQDLSILEATSWYDGFNVSIFGSPWWVNIFYVTFQGILITLSLYMLIRGLN